MDRDQTILTEDGSSEEPKKVFLCERCKVAMNKTELAYVYRCPVCFTVVEEPPKDQTIVEEQD